MLADFLGMKVTLTTYKELHDLVQAWAITGKLTLLAITSRPGLGKTEAAIRTAGQIGVDKILRLDTHCSPLQLYIALYLNRGKPVIMDDLSDHILENQTCLSILKAICDSRETRTVQYNSTTPLLKASGTPPAYETTSPVLLLTNKFESVTPAQEALLSRAINAIFTPPIDEILAYIEPWASNREIFAWYARNIHLFPMYSARDYTVSASLAAAGLDWKTLALKSAGITPAKTAPNQQAIPF